MFYNAGILVDNIGKFKIQAKIYGEGSCYGINNGPISKLWIWDEETTHTVYTWDRGDEYKDSKYTEVVDEIIKSLLAIYG